MKKRAHLLLLFIGIGVLISLDLLSGDTSMPSVNFFALISLVLAGIVSLIAYPVVSKRVAALSFCVLFATFLVAIPLLYQWQRVTKPSRRIRAAQREMVQSRVSQAGGWAVLERECGSFIEASRRYDGLPGGTWREVPTGYPALNALQPREISVFALQGGGGYVRIELFGMRSTGRGTPFYYLVVPSRPVDDVASFGFRRERLEQITNLIYEVH